MALIFTEEDQWQIEREISEFEEWQNRLNEDLSYLMCEPPTDENLAKLASVIDYHFSDMLFQHEDHEIKVERLPDGGIGITVMLEYDDPSDYYVDFEVEPGVNFEIRVPSEHMFAEDINCEVQFWTELGEEIDRWNAQAEAIFAAMDAVEAENTKDEEPRNESPDDILFAPIKPEEKQPEPASDPYYGEGC
jgi:hypothetical protein